jgi:hypothetical protein
VSRTRKGQKGPGWEPWTNIREREKASADARAEHCRNGRRTDDSLRDLGPCPDCEGTGCEEETK